MPICLLVIDVDHALNKRFVCYSMPLAIKTQQSLTKLFIQKLQVKNYIEFECVYNSRVMNHHEL